MRRGRVCAECAAGASAARWGFRWRSAASWAGILDCHVGRWRTSAAGGAVCRGSPVLNAISCLLSAFDMINKTVSLFCDSASVRLLGLALIRCKISVGTLVDYA